MADHIAGDPNCPGCAEERARSADVASLPERVARLETLVAQLDDVLSKVVRETPSGRSEIEEILKAARSAIPASLPPEETVKGRKGRP